LTFFHSITWRLARWFGACLVVAMLLAEIVVYFGVEQALRDTAWRELHAEVQAVASRLTAPGDAHHDVRSLTDPDLFPQDAGMYFQIAGPDGSTVNRSAGAQPLPWRLTPSGRTALYAAPSGRLVYVVVALSSPQGTKYLTVATAWGPFVGYLRTLRVVLEVVGLGAVACGAAGGVLISRSALRPVEEITQAVRRLGPEALSARLPVEGPPDELHRLRETFNDMLSRIEVARRRQTEFIADASHELRTPVAIIEGYVALVLRWGRDEPTVLAESLEAIARESRWLARLVADLLTVTRLDSGPPAAESPVDLVNVSRQAAADARTLAPGLHITEEYAPVPEVLGDRGRLRQLLFILLDNAIKYTPAGGRITVALTPAGSHVRLVVSDTGVGIDPGALPHVFERFYRADQARERTGGTGLGLAIARGIAQVHGGSIDIRSVRGEGTTVEVRLAVRRRGLAI